VESLRILPYTSVNVRVVNSQWLKFNAVNGQSPKISVVNSQTPKRAGQSFDLAVAAVTIESMGVTPPVLTMLNFKTSLLTMHTFMEVYGRMCTTPHLP